MKSTKKLAKSGLAMALAGSFVFSTSAVYAEEADSQPINLQEVMAGNEADPSTAVSESNLVDAPSEESDTSEPAVETGEVQEDVSEDVSAEAPSLVPGDLFYFIKIAFEKIQIAFTFDDAEEAKLLAEFAAERLAEAEALFAQGEEEKALETLEKALEHIQGTEQIIEETTNEENVDQTVAEDDEVVNQDENAIEETSDDENTLEETEKLISQNIIALSAVMEKVKNPVAKAALQKNIDKSYAKLAKKLEKFEDKKNKKKQTSEENVATDNDTVAADEATTVENSQTTDTNTSAETSTAPEAVTPAEENPVSSVTAPNNTANSLEATVVQPDSVQPAAETKPEVKEQKAAEKAVTKQEKQAAKVEDKNENNAANVNGNGQSNGKGQGKGNSQGNGQK